MSGVPDTYYDNERGLISPCMYRTGGFCNTSFASHGMKFFSFLPLPFGHYRYAQFI